MKFLIALIVDAFVVVTSLSTRHTCIPAFRTTRIRGIKARAISTTSNSFGCSSTRKTRVDLGMRKTNHENERELYTAAKNGVGSDYNKGLLVLATVPMAWGTFEPAVRLVYKYEPLMPPLVFSFAYYLVATSVLSIGKLWSAMETADRENGDAIEVEESPPRTTANNFGFLSNLSLSTRGGIELGTYLFIGNALQVIGLKTVSSDRAAFLLQLTTIFVPLLKSVNGQYWISRQTWMACLVALMGVALIGLDDGEGLNFNILDTIQNQNHIPYSLPKFSVDDGFIVLAAIFYTFHCIKLETYARSTTSAVGLATAKATTEMIWSGLAILVCILAANHQNDLPALVDVAKSSGEKILSYGEYIQQQFSSGDFVASGGWPIVGLATVWVGAITVAYTIYAQTFGQSKISAVTANLIYSSQPIFTALLAYFILGERLGPNGYIGGMLIGVAVLLVIVAEQEIAIEQTH